MTVATEWEPGATAPMLTPCERRLDGSARARVPGALRNSTSRRLPAALIAVAALALGCCALNGWGGDGLLCLLPALLLGMTLLARRYPGERLLRPARASASSDWPRARSSKRARPRPVATIARGGLLLGRSLAVRPPPLQLALS